MIQMGGDDVEIVVSNKASSPLYEQIAILLGGQTPLWTMPEVHNLPAMRLLSGAIRRPCAIAISLPLLLPAYSSSY